MRDDVLSFGVSGLGRGFMLMRRTFATHPRARLVAAFDPREEAREAFVGEFGGRGYAGFSELCADPDVDVIYVASPHEAHARQAIEAARAGKHVLIDKPMATTVEQANEIVAAAREAGVCVVAGPSHGFDGAVMQGRALIESGATGAVKMVTALNFTDFVHRPRRPDELDPAHGGGVVLSQASHQIDVVCRLAGERVIAVQAGIGDWDPARPTEGAYSAFLRLTGGVFATLTYSGYGRFDSDEFCDWISETGYRKDPAAHAQTRKASAASDSEDSRKAARMYGRETAPVSATAPPAFDEHFGFVLASCECGDIRLYPNRVRLYGNERIEDFEIAAPSAPRSHVIDELWNAVRGVAPATGDATWGAMIVAACSALRQSARERREVRIASSSADARG